jgi:hypothetical protein
VNDTPTPPRRKLFEAVIEVDEDGFVHARGENFTNRHWSADTLSQVADDDDGEVEFALLVRGRMRGVVVPGAHPDGGSCVRVEVVDGGERPRKFEGS